jgi:hypothetical protein
MHGFPAPAYPLDILKRVGTSSAISQGVFTTDEYRALLRAGFIVCTGRSECEIDSLRLADEVAIGGRLGSDAILNVPRLLGSGRAHLLALLRRSASGEAPLGLMKDRWDGAAQNAR